MGNAADFSSFRAIALAVWTIWGVACNGDPILVELLDYDSASDSYGFQKVAIETLENVNRLEGRATSLVGDAEIELNYETGLLTWDAPGYRVGFGAVKSDGVLIPEDFDSLAMVSIYYQIERSLLYFESIGLDSERLVPMNTYYWPTFTIIDEAGSSEVQKDNAFYLYISKKDRGFYVFPYEEFGWLPLSMNAGVMTHEYSHAVFDALVMVPNRDKMDGGGLSAPTANFIAALNEGFADTVAVARTGDPDYIAHSIAQGTFATSCNGAVSDVVRDASLPISYTADMDDDARTMETTKYCPYEIGAFVSSAMWRIARGADGLDPEGSTPAEKGTRAMVARAFTQALDTFGQQLSDGDELWRVFALFLEGLPTEKARAAACSTLSNLYAMHYDKIEGC